MLSGCGLVIACLRLGMLCVMLFGVEVTLCTQF